MYHRTLRELSAALRAHECSARELARCFIERIQARDADLNSFITVTEELALRQADQADRRIATGKAGPLTGIPLAHKDIFCTNGVRTSCGSRMLDS